jgi:hypothetical protein
MIASLATSQNWKKKTPTVQVKRKLLHECCWGLDREEELNH